MDQFHAAMFSSTNQHLPANIPSDASVQNGSQNVVKEAIPY